MAHGYYCRYSKRCIGTQCLDTESPRFSEVKVRECDRGHLTREVVQPGHEGARLGVQIPSRPLRKITPAQPILLRFCLPPSSEALLEPCLIPVHVRQDLQYESRFLAIRRAASHTCARHVVDRLDLHPLGFSFCVLFEDAPASNRRRDDLYLEEVERWSGLPFQQSLQPNPDS